MQFVVFEFRADKENSLNPNENLNKINVHSNTNRQARRNHV